MKPLAAWLWLLAAAPTLAAPALAQSPGDLVRAYPEQLDRIDGDMLIWRDGTRMALDAGPNALLDQLRQPYPAGSPTPPAPDADPGRIRNTAFFNKMYGDCRKGEVAPKLAQVVWMPASWGHKISITRVNGIDRQLAAIAQELETLPAPVRRTLYPIGGTYLCRSVADTGQTSMHGWGAAIDINVAVSDYWLWQRPRHGLPAYVNRVPSAVVEIFERHGFIWGGHWAHFDTMHFEYRPELLQGVMTDTPPAESQTSRNAYRAASP